jgi:hypothetical protein
VDASTIQVLKSSAIWNVSTGYVLGFFDKKRFKSILPSKSDLTRNAKRIETVADGITPMTQFHTASGEGIKFENVASVI